MRVHGGAREEEMGEVRKHEVYEKVPIEECWERTGKAPIQTRWIDINKGDNVHPEYRSRLVAKDFKRDNRKDLFAATPPLEALKMLISMWMTEGIGWNRDGQDHAMDFIDIRRAYFMPRRDETYMYDYRRRTTRRACAASSRSQCMEPEMRHRIGRRST